MFPQQQFLLSLIKSASFPVAAHPARFTKTKRLSKRDKFCPTTLRKPLKKSQTTTYGQVGESTTPDESVRPNWGTQKTRPPPRWPTTRALLAPKPSPINEALHGQKSISANSMAKATLSCRQVPGPNLGNGRGDPTGEELDPLSCSYGLRLVVDAFQKFS